MHTIQKTAFANSVTLVTEAFYILCSLLAWIAPDFYFSSAGTLFHWIKPSAIGESQAFGSFLLGVIYLGIIVWVMAYAIAAAYDRRVIKQVVS